jgi:hypothetical protein
MNFEDAMEFVSKPLNDDESVINLLEVILKGLVVLYGECAEANFEEDCACCQASVSIRKLRMERDEWQVDAGLFTRAEVEQRRADHEANLVAKSAAWMEEWNKEDKS